MKIFLLKIRKFIFEPLTFRDYFKFKATQFFTWDKKFLSLREPKAISSVSFTKEVQNKIEAELVDNDFECERFSIDPDEYKRFFEDAEYSGYTSYYLGGADNNGSFQEKTLEHFLAAKFLKLNREDTYIDIASSVSPVPDIYAKLYGPSVYRQDMKYETDLDKNIIGGRAEKMPVPDEYATKLGLHCSFEHFEGDSDGKFIKEAGRVLKKGGKMCILPLYLQEKHSILTNPSVADKDTEFDKDAVLLCVKNWRNSHGRFYDAKHLASRIKENLGDLKMKIYVIENAKEIHPKCFMQFAAVFEKQ